MPDKPVFKNNADTHISDIIRIELTFDNNQLATMLFGQLDQHLARLEQKLGIETIARGNSVIINGPTLETHQARRVLNHLYDQLLKGENIENPDVDGAIRMAIAADNQLNLPTMETMGNNARLVTAQISTHKKTIMARTPTQDAYIRAMAHTKLVFGVGPAGTGKTYLAVAHAAQLLERGQVERIILSRPAVEAGERLGFLPGDMKEKVDPYLRPLYDALYDMIPGEKVERALNSGIIEIAPLAFMRGRTLTNAAVILDEAQNTTPIQMKMFLTRLGENAHMIVTGDPSQIDLPAGTQSGLIDALDILCGLEDIVITRFRDIDVIRHPLVQKIVTAYDKDVLKKKLTKDHD